MSAFERAAVQRLIAKAEAAGIAVPDDVRELATPTCGADNGARLFAEAHPAADPAGCCWGETINGLEGCTCWVPEYDVDQTEPSRELVAEHGITVRDARCGDCAYRRDSPENAESWTADHLVELAMSGEPFWCHDGMRRPARWRHPKRGVVEGSTADWRPPSVAGVPFRADGRPALLCAGWAAEGRRQARLAEADEAAS